MGRLTRSTFFSVTVTVLILTTFMLLGIKGQDIIFKDEEDLRSEDPECNIPNGCKGRKCVDIRFCLVLFALVGNREHHNFLKQAQCGWNQTIPMVWCDTKWNCTTSKNEPGRCVKLTSCPHTMLLQSANSQETVAYMEANRCGSDKYDVCCTSVSSEVKNKVPESSTTATATESPEIGDCKLTSALPSPQCCGMDAGANRIVGGEATLIDEYPWTAAIEYAVENTVRVKCGGTLITGTFVVTAAHCLVTKGLTPLNVRLGDYDIDHEGADCVKVEGDAEDCADAVLKIPIAKTIVHPNYNGSLIWKPNDIGLIKLQDTAPYTDFIRPICLPTTDFTEAGLNKLQLRVAGWGATGETQKYNPIKLHVAVPFVSRKFCSDVYDNFNVVLGDGQICAGGEEGKDSCKGDSGGGLMYIKNEVTELVGITSFGYTPCGTQNKPAIYTKVYYYLPWIKSVIS